MTKNSLTLYIAGKVSKESVFGTHHWRDDFCAELSRLSGLRLDHLDPVRTESGMSDPRQIFAKDCRLINCCDAMVVYLSDDISVGGSQEILMARYLHKPVIGLAPFGGKFNGSRREMPDIVIENYQDPFVFSTCDRVCGSVNEVAEALKEIENIQSAGLQIIDDALAA